MDKFILVKEASAKYNIPQATLRNWMRDKKVRYNKELNLYHIDILSLEKWLSRTQLANSDNFTVSWGK